MINQKIADYLYQLLKIRNFIYTYRSILDIDLNFTIAELKYAIQSNLHSKSVSKYNKLLYQIITQLANYILTSSSIYQKLPLSILLLLKQNYKYYQHQIINFIIPLIQLFIENYFPQQQLKLRYIVNQQNINIAFQQLNYQGRLKVIEILIAIIIDLTEFKNGLKEKQGKQNFIKGENQNEQRLRFYKQFYVDGSLKYFGGYVNKENKNVQMFMLFEDKNTIYEIDEDNKIRSICTVDGIKQKVKQLHENKPNFNEKNIIINLYLVLKNNQFVQISSQLRNHIQHKQNVQVTQYITLPNVQQIILKTQKIYSQYLDNYWGSRWMPFRQQFVSQIQNCTDFPTLRIIYTQFIKNHNSIENLYVQQPPKLKQYHRKYSVAQMEKLQNVNIKKIRIFPLKSLQRTLIYLTEPDYYIGNIVFFELICNKVYEQIKNYIQKKIEQLKKIRRNYESMAKKKKLEEQQQQRIHKIEQKKHQNYETLDNYVYKKSFVKKSKKMLIQE